MLLTLTISRKEIIQLNSVLSKRKRVLIWLFLDFNHQRSIIQSGKEVLFRLGNSSISSSALQIFPSSLALDVFSDGSVAIDHIRHGPRHLSCHLRRSHAGHTFKKFH